MDEQMKKQYKEFYASPDPYNERGCEQRNLRDVVIENRWSNETKRGKFHSWGIDNIDGKPFTVGIVELSNGKVEMVRADRVQFIN